MLLAGRTQKAHPDKIEDFLLRLRKRRNILLFKLDGREDGVVICDLAVVGYAGNVRSCLLYTSLRHICRLFPVVDLKDISEYLAAFDGFRDNDAGNALVVGLFRIETEGVMIPRPLNKDLIFIKAVRSMRTAEPHQRLVFGVPAFGSAADDALVYVENSDGNTNVRFYQAETHKKHRLVQRGIRVIDMDIHPMQTHHTAICPERKNSHNE